MPDDADRVRREASDWFILLREDAEDAALRARFDVWLNSDHRHCLAWESMNETFAVIGAVKPLHSSDYCGHEPRLAAPAISPAAFKSRQRRIWRAGAGGAAALAACVLLAVAGPQFWLSLKADHVTGISAEKTVRLADGTEIDLAPKTAITVAEGADGRDVQLLYGEAWFKVRHDPAHPFKVQAGKVLVTDVGTQFDVSLQRQGQVTVSVGEGEVNVVDGSTPSLPPHDLRAGDWLRVTADHTVKTGTEDAALAGLWRQGELQVRGETVAAAIDEIRPWYSGVIILTNAQLGRQSVTGIYDLQTPQSALDALVSAHGGIVHHMTPWLLVVSGG